MKNKVQTQKVLHIERLVLHIEALKKLLNMKEPCTYCPRSFNHGMSNCKICRKFINISRMVSWFKRKKCPCLILGNKEAMKRTWIKLEEISDENDPFFNDESIDFAKRYLFPGADSKMYSSIMNQD